MLLTFCLQFDFPETPAFLKKALHFIPIVFEIFGLGIIPDVL